MAVLATVSDYLTSARVLLQDTVSPYRYSDDELVVALNLGFAEARRLRPDMFLSDMDDVPSYSSTSQSAAVAMDIQYRSALLYYIVGHAQLRDEEDSTDTRAAALLSKFSSQLMTLS